jgi:hypothetical protein
MAGSVPRIFAYHSIIAQALSNVKQKNRTSHILSERYTPHHSLLFFYYIFLSEPLYFSPFRVILGKGPRLPPIFTEKEPVYANPKHPKDPQ